MILLGRPAVERRRAEVARHGDLASLADSLRRDLDVVLARPVWVPEEKARMSRAGGRCPHDAAWLEFDPFSPREHRCPRCRSTFADQAHYRWWIMNYQLWLAERTVHGATVHLLRGDPACADFARAVMSAYVDAYPNYPNADNVLGPTRPFFSTYLESIWQLQLCVAASALDAADGESSATGRLRDEVIAPGARLIRSYDEGASNRQVWNAAALAAAGALLGDRAMLRDAITGPSGVAAHLAHGLLPDGTWYEGENYHLFAHRGLWYGIMLADAAGISLGEDLIARFDEGAATPFVTALPDMTFPARRDSQYAVTLRQWRFAELAELGLARRDDRRLRSALRELYDGSVAPGDTGRARSTAEAERNGPPTGLSRADLGWRSLLCALPELPPLDVEPRTSTILPAQGYAIFRRDAGRVYVGFDYGNSGGGHGHPDRLNLLLSDGPTRWLDDMGTGSYVDPTLHWYRSTLAHNAPVANGRSQARVDGSLLAWDERGGFGWVEARVDGAYPEVGFLRTLVVAPDYLVDRLIWWGAADTRIDLPIHVDADLDGARWTAAPVEGTSAPDDGYAWLRDVEVLEAPRADALVLRLRAEDGEHADLAVLLPRHGGATLWRARAPGPPSAAGRMRPMHLVRASGPRGVIVSVWSWRGAVRGARAEGNEVVVELDDGAEHRHARSPHGWTIAMQWRQARSRIELTGRVEDPEPQEASPPPAAPDPFDIPVAGDAEFDAGAPVPALEFELEGQHYRRSEVGWHEAGSPSALVALMATPSRLIVEVAVRKPPAFAPPRAENPLDNEHPDTNSDGVQLYLGASGGSAAWILVPEPGGGVRITPRTPAAERAGLSARWRPSAEGWEIRAVLPREFIGGERFHLDLIVNEIPEGRERRRGQLVLSGGAGEFVYLRGDRQPDSRFIPFRFAS